MDLCLSQAVHDTQRLITAECAGDKPQKGTQKAECDRPSRPAERHSASLIQARSLRSAVVAAGKSELRLPESEERPLSIHSFPFLDFNG